MCRTIWHLMGAFTVAHCSAVLYVRVFLIYLVFQIDLSPLIRELCRYNCLTDTRT